MVAVGGVVGENFMSGCDWLGGDEAADGGRIAVQFGWHAGGWRSGIITVVITVVITIVIIITAGIKNGLIAASAPPVHVTVHIRFHPEAHALNIRIRLMMVDEGKESKRQHVAGWHWLVRRKVMKRVVLSSVVLEHVIQKHGVTHFRCQCAECHTHGCQLHYLACFEGSASKDPPSGIRQRRRRREQRAVAVAVAVAAIGNIAIPSSEEAGGCRRCHERQADEQRQDDACSCCC
mmetsp:Transcript_5725/g.16968  ORF Transcript_5725/g.16968 Transcript_5725/m.16968 type:complete len:234 (+) Transcript_5725:1969-2670(+)